MEEKRILIFDIWGEYAHYKKIYLTTSALSYAIPFKTSIFGLIGAFLGLEKENSEYLKSFDDDRCKIGIQVISPIKYQKININLSDEPGPIKGNRKPTTMEFVKKPHYRIFFTHTDDELYKKFLNSVKNRKSVYTPVLGIANCITNYCLISDSTYKINKNNDFIIISSIITKNSLIEFDSDYWLKENLFIQEQDMYPIEMNTNREVTKRDTIFYEVSGKPLKAKVNEFLEIKFDNSILNVVVF